MISRERLVLFGNSVASTGGIRKTVVSFRTESRWTKTVVRMKQCPMRNYLH